VHDAGAVNSKCSLASALWPFARSQSPGAAGLHGVRLVPAALYQWTSRSCAVDDWVKVRSTSTVSPSNMSTLYQSSSSVQIWFIADV
jgi:hypothetical protein